LARPVGADQADHLAAAHRQRDVVEGQQPLEADGDALDLELGHQVVTSAPTGLGWLRRSAVRTMAAMRRSAASTCEAIPSGARSSCTTRPAPKMTPGRSPFLPKGR